MEKLQFYQNIIVVRDELGIPLTIYTYELDYYNCDLRDKFFLSEDAIFANYKINRFYHNKFKTLLKQYSLDKIGLHDYSYYINCNVNEYIEAYKNSKIDWKSERIGKFYFDNDWNLNLTLVNTLEIISKADIEYNKLYDICSFPKLCSLFSYFFNLILKFPEEQNRLTLTNSVISKNMFENNLQDYDNQDKYIDVFQVCNSYYKLEYKVEDEYTETILFSMSEKGNLVCFMCFKNNDSNLKLSA